MKYIPAVLLFVLSAPVAAQAAAKEANPKMPKSVHTDGAPPAKGPYSQGVDVQGSRMLFLSGQTARDPKTGELVTSGADHRSGFRDANKGSQGGDRRDRRSLRLAPS